MWICNWVLFPLKTFKVFSFNSCRMCFDLWPLTIGCSICFLGKVLYFRQNMWPTLLCDALMLQHVYTTAFSCHYKCFELKFHDFIDPACFPFLSWILCGLVDVFSCMIGIYFVSSVWNSFLHWGLSRLYIATREHLQVYVQSQMHFRNIFLGNGLVYFDKVKLSFVRSK